MIVSIPHHVVCLRPVVPAEGLVVTLPKAVYFGATASHSRNLLERIKKSKILPTGWSMEDRIESQSIFTISKSFGYGVVEVTISSNCQCTVKIDDYNVRLSCHLLYFDEEKVESVNYDVAVTREC